MAENITGFQTKDGVALVDYDYLANKPVTRIVSDSADAAPVLRTLESGSYVLQGKFRAYTGATSVLGFSSALMVNVIKGTSKSSVQIFYPVNNCVQFLEITDEAMTKTFVYLNQVLEHIGTMKDLNTEEKTSLVAAINELVDMVSSMSGGTGGGITEETDPTVPEWAKQSAKPTYTADEVKARPDTWMPTAEDVGARPSTWTPTASDVGADAIGTAASKVTEHNTATDTHNDIRLLIQGLDARLTALADSDDTTLDQLSELVAYIKANRGLIESITSDKVNVADIINNLTTNATNKPLSAAQGVALKSLIDALTTTVNGKVTSAQVTAAINSALSSYLTTSKAAELYQPKGDYAAASHNHDGTYAKPSDIPTVPSALPNPKALVILGKSYDGSTEVALTVEEIMAAIEEASGGVSVKVEGTKIILSGNLPDDDYVAYYKVVDEDGNETLVEIGPMVPKDEAEKDFTVTFVADGTTVAEIGYNVGDTIEEPAVPAKSGYNMGIWEDYDLTAGGNITVNAKYLNNLLIDAGYESGKRIQVNNGATKTETNACVSGYIPVANLAKYFYLYDITLSSAESVNNVIFYRDATDSDDASTILDDKYVLVKGIAGVANAFNSSVKVGQIGDKNYYYLKANSWSGTENAQYFRFSCAAITGKSIVTYDDPL